MEFHQLRYFVAAAEELSISKAARRVNVSQPAMSRQIKMLEDEIGVPLFDRVKQRIHLTEAGTFFLFKTRQLLCDSESAVQQVREKFVGVRQTLRLGFLSPFLDDLVAPAVREFKQRHQQAKVSLFDLSPRAQLDRLRLRELDLAILANLEDAERKFFKVLTVSKHRFVALLPENHRLSNKVSVGLSELKNDDWISLSNTFFPKRREFLIATCAKAGFAPKIVAEMDSLPMMLAEIGTGGGVGLMPGHAAKLPHAGCVVVELREPTVESELLLVLAKDPHSKELETLTALLAERAAGI